HEGSRLLGKKLSGLRSAAVATRAYCCEYSRNHTGKLAGYARLDRPLDHRAADGPCDFHVRARAGLAWEHNRHFTRLDDGYPGSASDLLPGRARRLPVSNRYRDSISN